MKFYVVGGTFKEDPLLRKGSGITFMCGEVKTEKESQHKFLLQRRIYTERLKGKWLTSMYDMIPEKSPGYQFPNHMEAKIHRGLGTLKAGIIYLLLSDFDSCALFYHKRSGDCELWEKKRPGRNGLPSSFCSKYIHACNNKSVIWYYNQSKCYFT
uniref:Putative salivary lipocalin n=1 Tax=Ixodes ricinus TaxID=34613 RepID=A0A147BW53_IXORI